MNTTLYLVGHNTMENGDNTWEFAGIFSSEQKAIDNCFDETYWLAKVQMDEEVPQCPTDFEYAYYPKLK